MFTPENELGVIVVFAQEGPRHGFHIKAIQAAFPDAVVEKGGVSYRAEFEFRASSFDQHGHDYRKCDLIICWDNDRNGSCILPILALSEQDWAATDLALPMEVERKAYYWRRRALVAERTLRIERAAQSEPIARDRNGKPMLYRCDFPGCLFAARTQNGLNAHKRAHKPPTKVGQVPTDQRS